MYQSNFNYNEQNKVLVEETLNVSDRTYSFEIKENKSGKKYLVITETKTNGNYVKRNNIIIYEDALNSFAEYFMRIMSFLEDNLLPVTAVVDERYKRSGDRWTAGEEIYLHAKHKEGVPVAEIADILKRNPEDIISRQRKLGL